ncbi:MAG: polymer-forming cytoskeletal protein [Deltaproteobacteria bacterium]|nr:polymer-forming cytoskeletal protein [Deltaproteobacteria bacterium]
MTNTIIGSSIVIDGEISGDEELVIQGTVKGRIVLKENLFIEASGVAEADVETRNVSVSGKLTGDVHVSEKCEINDGGKVVGDIKAPRIVISDGAIFKGNVDMEG